MKTHIHKISRHVPSIFQGKFDFSSAQSSISLSIEHRAERIALRFLSLALIAIACGYLYFIAASILNVVAREEMLAQVSVIQGSIGALEQRHFELTKSISPQSGQSLGLAPVADKHYVYRPGNVGATSIARNEI